MLNAEVLEGCTFLESTAAGPVAVDVFQTRGGARLYIPWVAAWAAMSARNHLTSGGGRPPRPPAAFSWPPPRPSRP